VEPEGGREGVEGTKQEQVCFYLTYSFLVKYQIQFIKNRLPCLEIYVIFNDVQTGTRGPGVA
jgi:hypothetical protein